MKFRIGDHVHVTTGKDRGKMGYIKRISLKRDQAIIEGVNKRIKHIKAQGGEAGQRVEIFAPIDISNLMIVDPKTQKPSRIGYGVEGGQKVRIAKASGTTLPSGDPRKAPQKTAPAKKAASKK